MDRRSARRPLALRAGSWSNQCSQGRERFELVPPVGRGSWGLMPLAAAPYCDFANEGGARVASRRCPDWLGVTFGPAYLKLAGRVRYRRSDIEAYEQAGFVTREPAEATSLGDPSDVRETVERLIRSLGS